MSNNYSELFCQAIDTIVTERLNAVVFDKTVLCTIVDDSKRKEGRYVVTETNSQTKFEAFSSNTDYRNNTNVYVTIPEGDMNQAKFIIGKKNTDDKLDSYTYTRPFDTIVDVSGNLISTEIPIENTGLVANEPDTDGQSDGYHTITLWTYNNEASTVVADKGENLDSFTRLGIRGDFRSWLSQFYVETGNGSVAAGTSAGSYGLRLRVKTIKDNIVYEDRQEGIYDFYLDAADMNGNPYNFSTFYRQEKVFNIETIGQIVSMQLQFYEKPGTFKNDLNGDLIPWQDFLGNKINPNLFVKDCHICVGYDVAAFEDDQVMLYTLNNKTYRADATDLENQKLIQLRWVNDFDGKLKVVNETDNIDAEVRWYKYQLGAPSPEDSYLDQYWTRVNDKITVTQSAPMTDIEALDTFDIVYHYRTAGNINSDEFCEEDYIADFQPEYRVPKTQNIDRPLGSGRSLIFLWSDECLAYYGFKSAPGEPEYEAAFLSQAYVNQNYDHNIEKSKYQSWTEAVKQGFMWHEKTTSREYADYWTDDAYSYEAIWGCTHRLGTWERLVFAWRMYSLCTDSFDKLLTKNIWKHGGNNSTGVWDSIGNWDELRNNGGILGLKYSGNKIYPASSTIGTTITENTTNTTALRNAGSLFADSFGPWTLIQDKYGLYDYVPGSWVQNADGEWEPETAEDQATYNLIREAIEEVFYKMDNPTYTIELKPNSFSYLFTPDVSLQEERLRAVVVYNGQILRSNVLYFYNENEVVSQPTVNALSALDIVTLDASDGNYFIYDIGNSLKNHADGPTVRELDLYFNGAQLTTANKVEWLIPTENTMIVLDDNFKGAVYDETSMPGWCKITRYGGGEKGDDITGNTRQQYRIKSHWSQDDTNNTIYCTVTQYGTDFPATQAFMFGPSGTSGTDCTLTLSFENGVTALTVGNPSAVNAKARLYDYNNQLVDLTNYTLEWEITAGLTSDAGQYSRIIPITDQNDMVELQTYTTVTSVPQNNYDILKVTVTDFGDYDLIAYLPLPIRETTDYKYIEGATQLIYNSIGTIDNYYKNPYAIYYTNENGQLITTYGRWLMYNGNETDINYLPTLIEEIDKENGNAYYKLQATNIYVPETCTKVGVRGIIDGRIVWSQPLLIMQNRYPSAMVNEWDGSLKIDEKNNAILAAKMVAGRKEDDNSFSGVMMGDWYGEDIEDVIANHTGLYGFNYGKASFGFRDDGTAFIGKPGSGRIEFNGNEGQITSNSYEYGAGGIKIDLDDGILYAQSPNNTIDDSELNTGMRKGYLTINASHTTTPLSIGDEEDGGRSNYFYVDWDGTFKATTGYIGPWQLDADGFTNGEEGEDKIYLYANGTMVMGTGADRIKLESGRITIGNNSSANRIILSSGTDTTPAGILIGPTKNQIQIGDAAITMGNFNESSTSSRIKIDSSSIQMGEYDSDTEEFGNNTLINDEGITVTCPSDDGQTQYTTISYDGVSSTEFIVLEYTGQAAGEGNVAGGLRYGYTNYGNDNDDILGVELYSANYSDRRPQDGSIFKVTDYHIAGTTYESQMILDEEKAVIGMITGQSGLTGKSGSVRCDADGLTLRGGVINFSNVTEINFTNTDEVTIDFSNVYAKNLYAVLA